MPQPGAREWTPAQYGGYVPPADGKGGGQVLIKSVNGKVVITPVPGTGPNPTPTSTTNTSSSTTPAAKKQPASTNQAKVTQAQAPSKKPLGPIASPTPPPTNTLPPPS